MNSHSSDTNLCRYLTRLLSFRRVSEAERALEAFTRLKAISPEHANFYHSVIDQAKAKSDSR